MHKGKSVLSLEINRDQPVYPQIISAITGKIQTGELQPGTPIPGSRQLAEGLNVNRQTVVEAYDRLIAQGWLQTSLRKGTFVNEALPDTSAWSNGKGHQISPKFDYKHFPQPSQLEDMSGMYWAVKFDDGFPDPQMGPFQELNAAYRRAYIAVKRRGDIIHGHPLHLQVIGELDKMLRSARGVQVDPDHTCFIRGGQMALYLIAHCLLKNPGEAIAIEDPGNPFFRRSLQVTGAELVPIPVDQDGIDLDALSSAAMFKPLRAVVITPHSQYPTTVTMSLERRKALKDLAEQFRFAIIEVDLNGEFWYESYPDSRLVADNRDGNVIYLSCLSAMMPPLSFINYVIGPVGFITTLRNLWQTLDNQEDLILENAILELMREGILARYARRSSASYRIKRDHVASMLRTYMDNLVNFNVPRGGLAFWLTFKKPIDTNTLLEQLVQQGVYVPPPAPYSFESKDPQALRLGFASLDDASLEKAIKTMRSIMREM